jgi:hypothetical protein
MISMKVQGGHLYKKEYAKAGALLHKTEMIQ